MTKRLYYDDSRLITFDAEIIETRIENQRIAVRLDKTAFYPSSGGQPFDTGLINTIDVTDVWEEGDQIWHQMVSIPEDNQVNCKVNWERRFDHMQQHSGQHILSAIFLDLIAANTIGFHLGDESSTIDLNINQLNNKEIEDVEERVNQVIWENHPVKIQFINENEINKIPFRKPPQITGRIRVIRIGELDASACGGTHVQNTGEIGLLKINGFENYKGGTRVSFHSGLRGLKQYQKIQSNVKQISTSLSIHQDDILETIQRIQQESIENLRSVNRIKKDLMSLVAEKIWQETIPINGIKGVIGLWEDYSMDDLRAITNYLRDFPNTIILLATIQGEKISLISSKTKDLKEIQADSILSMALEKLGGKGGGTEEMAQGGVIKTDQHNIIKILQDTLIKYLAGRSNISN